MSIAEWNVAETDTVAVPLCPDDSESRPLHRIRDVRRRQGVSVRTCARRMDVGVDQVRQEEREDCDLSLTELYRWQVALEVPVSDLLVDLDAPLSPPVLQRARMLKMMKTALAIRENAENESVELLSQMMIDQILEVMPELAEVHPWHTVGQRRTLEDLGRTAENCVPDNFYIHAQS